MTMRKLLTVLPIVLIAALVLPAPAFAAEPEQGQIVMGGSFTLEDGETLHGDLVVFGGSIDLRQGSTVQGDVLLLGGNADIDGEITGDLALLGGNAVLSATAVVDGNIVSLGGGLNQAEGAEIGGDVISADEFSFPFEFDIPAIPSVDDPFGTFGFRFNPLWEIVWFGFRSLLIAALAILVVIFWPEPTERAARAVVSQPILSGGLGLLTFICGPILLIVLAITIILSPVSLLAAVLLVVAAVFGWIVIGTEVGRRLAEAFKWEIHPAASAGIGTLGMSLVVGGIGLVPCIGWLATLVVAAVGLGAVLLTRFGSREYLPATAEAAPAAKKSTTRKAATKKKS
jgi:hypothetical protein